MNPSPTEIPAVAGAAACALLATLALTPAAIWLARRSGVVDQPGHLKLQAAPVPYLGGLALLAGALLGLWTGATVATRTLFEGWTAALACLGLGIGAVGLLDDLYGLSPWLRLAAEAGAGLFLARLAGPMPGTLGLALAAVLVPIACNAINLIDGLDGLAAGQAAQFGAFAALAGGSRGDWRTAILGASMAGACLGFLRYNWRPAAIYMGDCGSLFLGLWIAAITLCWLGHNGISSWTQPAAWFLFPLVDVASAIARRLARGKSPFEGDRDHLYDILSRTALGVPGAVLTCLAASTALSAVAWIAR